MSLSGTGFVGKVKVNGVDIVASGWADYNDYRLEVNFPLLKCNQIGGLLEKLLKNGSVEVLTSTYIKEGFSGHRNWKARKSTGDLSKVDVSVRAGDVASASVTLLNRSYEEIPDFTQEAALLFLTWDLCSLKGLGDDLDIQSFELSFYPKMVRGTIVIYKPETTSATEIEKVTIPPTSIVTDLDVDLNGTKIHLVNAAIIQTPKPQKSDILTLEYTFRSEGWSL